MIFDNRFNKIHFYLENYFDKNISYEYYFNKEGD